MILSLLNGVIITSLAYIYWHDFKYSYTFPKKPWCQISSGVGAYFGAQCEKEGLLVRVAGDNIMMSPPFIMTPEEVDEVHTNNLLKHHFLTHSSHS